MTTKLKTFRWQGIDKKQQSISGTLDAINARFAKAALNEQQIIIKKIYRSYSWPTWLSRQRKISQKEIVLFVRQLATLLSSGIPLLQALDIAIQNSRNKSLAKLLSNIKTNIQEGNALSNALKPYPHLFNALTRQFIHTGEQTGSLDNMLQHIAAYQERTLNMKAKIKKALLYPCVVIGIAVLITAAMLIFIVPQFANLFESFGATLPLPTRITIEASQFLSHYWWLLLLIIIFPILFFKALKKKSSRFSAWLDYLILRIPLIGTLVKKGMTTNLCQLLATTHTTGIPLLESLNNIKNLTTNIAFQTAIKEAQNNLEHGETLHKALQHTGLFSKMTLQMVAIGEEAGKLDEMLNKIASFYESEVHQLVDNLGQILEPLIMVVLGIVIGGLVVTMYLPVFKLGTIL